MTQYWTAQRIYDVLYRAGLLEAQGEPSSADDMKTQGKRYDSSPYSDDDIDMYVIDIEVWQDELDTLVVQDRLVAQHFADETCLVCVASTRWALLLRQGPPDAAIPRTIDQELLSALGEGEVLWKRPIPAPHWFDMRFQAAEELLAELEGAGLLVSRCELSDLADGGEPDDYIVESVEDGTFAPVELTYFGRPGEMVCVGLHVLLDEHWGEHTPAWLNQYFPWFDDYVTVSDDGWVVRVLSQAFDLTGDDLLLVAEKIQSVLGGVVRGGLSEGQDDKPAALAAKARSVEAPDTRGLLPENRRRVTVAALEAGEVSLADVLAAPSPEVDAVYGPQAHFFEAFFKRLWRTTISEAQLFSSDAIKATAHRRAEAQERASQLAAFVGRTVAWQIVVQQTGPSVTSPLWFAQARSSVPANEPLLRVGYSFLFSAQCAAQALLLRDLLLNNGELARADYSLLTWPWRSVFGPVHPEDA